MIVEWPKEKKNPAPTGRFPSAMSLRVVLSMQEVLDACTGSCVHRGSILARGG
jgi:hypothetical protein